MKDSILIQAWSVYRYNGSYYIEYTHAIYLKNIRNMYEEISLVSPIKDIDFEVSKRLSKIHESVSVFELPDFSSYISAYKNFLNYVKLYNSLKHKKFDTVYSRFPSPFGWLQKIFFKSNRVVHFVGDPIDTLLKNPHINFFNKVIKIIFFLPEYFLFLWSAYGKKVKVFSNGYHIANKLKKLNINAKPMISTTLVENDFYIKNIEEKNNVTKLIYVGYLRKAKGVEVIVDAFKILKDKYPEQYSLTIVGSGEEEKLLKEKSDNFNLEIDFLGHIDNRHELNSILRTHDIFCFASLSEGSPRVILEAIANGLNIISTPVGSLPFIFKNNEDLLYFKFDDPIDLFEKISFLKNQKDLQAFLQKNAFDKVKKFKIDKFIGEVFDA